MAILAYAYVGDVAGTNTELGHLTNPKILSEPPVSILMTDESPTGLSQNWYRKPAYDNNDANPRAAERPNPGPPVLVTEIPSDSTELWIRFLDNSNIASYYDYWNWSNDTLFVVFYNISNGVIKTVAKVWGAAGNNGGTGNFYYTLYGDDGTTVVKQHRISGGNQFRGNAATKEMIVDLRFSFDKVAGFIQQYDYSATRIAEILGQTLNNLPITHVSVFSDSISPQAPSHRSVLFRIVANEPTFGMYVMPFYSKGEGTDQNQIAGDYNRFKMGRRSFTTTIGVALEKPDNGDPARYSFVPKTLAEQGLPANYNILSVQVNAIVDGIAATADPISFSTYLKQVSTGTRFELPQNPVKNNVDFAVSKTPQVRVARWDKNPVTGQNWQPGDFSDFEIGFKI